MTDDVLKSRTLKEETLDMIDELGIKAYALKQVLLKSLYKPETVDCDVETLTAVKGRVLGALESIKATDGVLTDLSFD